MQYLPSRHATNKTRGQHIRWWVAPQRRYAVYEHNESHHGWVDQHLRIVAQPCKV